MMDQKSKGTMKLAVPLKNVAEVGLFCRYD